MDALKRASHRRSSCHYISWCLSAISTKSHSDLRFSDHKRVENIFDFTLVLQVRHSTSCSQLTRLLISPWGLYSRTLKTDKLESSIFVFLSSLDSLLYSSDGITHKNWKESETDSISIISWLLEKLFFAHLNKHNWRRSSLQRLDVLSIKKSTVSLRHGIFSFLCLLEPAWIKRLLLVDLMLKAFDKGDWPSESGHHHHHHHHKKLGHDFPSPSSLLSPREERSAAFSPFKLWSLVSPSSSSVASSSHHNPSSQQHSMEKSK